MDWDERESPLEFSVVNSAWAAAVPHQGLADGYAAKASNLAWCKGAADDLSEED